MMNRSRRILFKLVFAAAAMFVALLAGDRLLGRMGRVQVRSDADYIQRFIRLKEQTPSVTRQIFMPDELFAQTDGLDRKTCQFRTDANGFIEPSAVHTNPDVRIVFLGGSTTECIHVPETSRFVCVVARILERGTGRKINAYNSGVSGNDTLHDLDILINKALPMKPQFAVLMENINDLSTLLYEGSYWNDSATRSAIVTVDRRPRTRQLLGAPLRSLFPHLHAMAGATLSRAVDVGDEFAHVRGKKIVVEKERVLAGFEKSVRSFVAICRINGITPVLMTQANRIAATPDDFIKRTLADKLMADFQIKWEDYFGLYSSINETIRKIAASEAIPIVDLDAKIPKDRRYIYDPVHFNEQGSLLAAEVIAPVLAQQITPGAQPQP